MIGQSCRFCREPARAASLAADCLQSHAPRKTSARATPLCCYLSPRAPPHAGKQGLASGLAHSAVISVPPAEPVATSKQYLPEAWVDADADHSSHWHVSCGETTSASSHSWYNAASRRGGQLPNSNSRLMPASPDPQLLLLLPLCRCTTIYHAVEDRSGSLAVGITNTIERPHEQFKRRIKINTSATAAAMLS